MFDDVLTIHIHMLILKIILIASKKKVSDSGCPLWNLCGFFLWVTFINGIFDLELYDSGIHDHPIRHANSFVFNIRFGCYRIAIFTFNK